MSAGLLGDTTARDYSAKLHQFNRFAEPELQGLLGSLSLSPGMRVLDAGCGTGEALLWLQEAVGEQGTVIGIDLSAAHVAAARLAAPKAQIHFGDLMDLSVPGASLDLIWCTNTMNHLRDPARGVSHLKAMLRPGGRIALGQSAFLPDMVFAWDSRLERLVNEAVRQYYRDRYALDEKDLTGIRRVLGQLRECGFADVTARTVVIERISPLDAASVTYLQETIFQGTWGERLRPYLEAEEFRLVQELSDPRLAGYALRRPDFHFVQTFTLVVGRAGSE
jgi:ubiquinone/menaquinone biosynthesis C-methylase UbiE